MVIWVLAMFVSHHTLAEEKLLFLLFSRIEGFAFKPDYVLIYNAWKDIKYLSSQKTVLRTLRPWYGQFDPRIHYRNMLDRWLCEGSQLYAVLRRLYYKTTMKIEQEGLRKAKDKQWELSELNPSVFVNINLQWRCLWI